MSLRGRFGALACALLLVPPCLSAQAPAAVVTSSGRSGSVADSYESTFEEVMGLRPVSDRVAAVSGLVLERDVARFALDQGSVQLLTPVNGRAVAAVFRGSGRFSFTPSSRVEQDRLARFEKAKALDAPFTELVLSLPTARWRSWSGGCSSARAKRPGTCGAPSSRRSSTSVTRTAAPWSPT